ncbi:LIC_12586 family protein [Leptospira chreensis]|uniref:LIC_12586 family protein n=1 Tax=Leptospira chreensis TaxID=2810035 RepID=UPI0038CC0963
MERIFSLKRLFSYRQSFSNLFNRIRENKRVLFSFLALGLIFFCFILCYYGLEFYLRNYRIPLVQLRKVVTFTINRELGKAVDIGVLDFSLREGLIIEDLVVSNEEDFSFNDHMLKVKKVTFRLSSYFKDSPTVEQIDFYSPHLVLNENASLRNQLIQYAQTSKLKDIRFHDAKLTVKQNDSTLVDWKEGWDIVMKRKNKRLYLSYNNGWFWIPNSTRIKGEGEFSDHNLDEYQFEFQWKNYPSEEAIILTNYLFGSNVHSAVLSGEGKVVRDAASGFTASGDVEFENSLIPIPFFENYILDGFRFRELFLFTPNKEEREFLGTDFRIKTSVKTETIKEPLLDRHFEFQIESLEGIAERISDLSGNFTLPLSGSLSGNIDLLETGDKNKWFQLRGNLSGSEMEWDSKLLQLEKGNLSLNLTEGNEWNLKFDSLLFGKPSHLGGGGSNEWGRSKKTDGSYYYPLNSKTKLGFQTPDLTGSDWKPLYEDWNRETLEEIRERQEKLIPEEYFYQTKVYKYFLESMNLDFGIQIANYYPFGGANSLGESKGNLQVKDGRMNLGLNLGNSNSKISMVSYYASKTPNFGFSLVLNEYPWSDPWMHLCGAELKPTHVSLDYSFNSMGSDYYTLHKDARTSYFLKLFGVSLKDADLVSKLVMDLSPLKKPFQMEFDLSRYSDMDYISNLVVSSESLDLKGYGNNKNGNYAFTTYGLVGESRGSFSLTEEENKCVLK